VSLSTPRLLADEAATEALGAHLAHCAQPGLTLYLEGDLGAGKTTLVRGFLRALGHTGAVKSPTYTIVEPYQLARFTLYHFDLYRLGDPEELEFIGIRDYQERRALSIVEWPERGAGILPPPDLTIRLSHHGDRRRALLLAGEPAGEAWLRCVEQRQLGAPPGVSTYTT